ncbi:MAG: hypothetical protein MR663_12205, partial [Lachnospiraceae bacterium]|nr:hypothetical protein [Lachnospiraceae bacterium]
KNWTGCSPGQMICRMNSGRKIKDKLSHLINRWLFLKKQGTDDYLLTLFSLVSLIEKGKQRYNQATKGHQQC